MQARSLFRHIENTYHVQAEYLWQGFPDYAVFRAPNRKWFALYRATALTFLRSNLQLTAVRFYSRRSEK